MNRPHTSLASHRDLQALYTDPSRTLKATELPGQPALPCLSDIASQPARQPQYRRGRRRRRQPIDLIVDYVRIITQKISARTNKKLPAIVYVTFPISQDPVDGHI